MARQHGQRRSRPGRAERRRNRQQPAVTVEPSLYNPFPGHSHLTAEEFWSRRRSPRVGAAVYIPELRCFLWGEYAPRLGIHDAQRWQSVTPRWHGRVIEDCGDWQVVEYPGWDLSGPRLVIRHPYVRSDSHSYSNYLQWLRNRGWATNRRLTYEPYGQSWFREEPITSTTEPLPFLGNGI
jgi:hypothetical protein